MEIFKIIQKQFMKTVKTRNLTDCYKYCARMCVTYGIGQRYIEGTKVKNNKKEN